MMPRKNNPKETVERILTASLELFCEKGFDKTSMQDIVDASDISKGAIFYHFNSKEEIFNAGMEKYLEHKKQLMSQLFVEIKGLTAKEKLKSLIEKSLADEEDFEANKVLATAIDSPHLLLAIMRGGLKKSAPLIAEIIREGVADGSITTEFPDECAEVFLLLYNYWCEPYIYECDLPTIYRRLTFLQFLMKQLGVDIITDEIITASMKFTENLYREVIKWTAQNQ